MTDDMMHPRDFLEKTPDADLLRAMIGFAAMRLMTLEVGAAKTAVTKVLCATWQRCRGHFRRNVAAHAGKSGRRLVSAFIATAFGQCALTRASYVETHAPGRRPHPSNRDYLSGAFSPARCPVLLRD